MSRGVYDPRRAFNPREVRWSGQQDPVVTEEPLLAASAAGVCNEATSDVASLPPSKRGGAKIFPHTGVFQTRGGDGDGRRNPQE